MSAPALHGLAPRRLGGVAALVVGVLLVAPPLMALYTDSLYPGSVRFNSVLLWAMCVAPALAFVLRSAERRRPIPTLALMALLYGSYFSLPVMTGSASTPILELIRPGYRLLDPAHDYAAPQSYALSGWAMLLSGYVVVGLFMRDRSVLQVARVWSVPRLRWWASLIAGGGTALQAVRLVLPLPALLGGAIQFAVSFGMFGIAVLVLLEIRGMLTPRTRLLLWGSAALAIVLAVSSGYVTNVFVVLATLVLAAWISGARFKFPWVVAMLIALATVVSMRAVIMDYRRLAWWEGSTAEMSVPTRAALVGVLLSDKVRTEGVVGTVVDGMEATAGRSGHFDLFARIVSRTPSSLPYWGGQTYLSLVGAFVPRVLWPDKPTKTLGQDFGHRYGLLDSYDFKTSINLPYLIEFYINFGETGVLVGMLLVGVILRFLDGRFNVPGQDVVASLASLILLFPLFNVESDFSLVFGGFVLNGVTMVVLMRFLGRPGVAGALPAPRTQPTRTAIAPQTA